MGASRGNRNALRHGRYTRRRRALYAAIRAQVARDRALIAWAKSVRALWKARRAGDSELLVVLAEQEAALRALLPPAVAPAVDDRVQRRPLKPLRLPRAAEARVHVLGQVRAAQLVEL